MTTLAAPFIERITRVRIGEELFYEAQPKQHEMHTAKEPYILYGGAAGGGKSHALRWHGHIVCLDLPKCKVLLIRKHSTELQMHHLLFVPFDLPESVMTYNAGHTRCHYSNGSLLQFGHFNNEAEFAKLLSSEWDVILVDESGELTENQLKLIPTRTGRSRVTAGQVIYGSNPGGPGHTYNYTHFVIHSVDAEEEPHYNADQFRFIFADIHDNKYLPPDYIEKIYQAPPMDQRRFLGDWELPTGNLYGELERARHLDWDDVPWIGSRRVVGSDWGWDAWAPAVWVETDTGFHGPARSRAYREWYPRETPPPVWALGVIERSEGEQIEAVVLDPAAWTGGQDGSPSVAEQMTEIFQAAEIRLVKAMKGPNSIALGTQLMHTYFWTAEGRVDPLFKIHASCKKLWNDLTTIQRGDVLKGQDPDCPKPKTKQTHGHDATRYVFQSRPRPATLTLAQRLEVDLIYQRFADDARSLEAAYQSRARGVVSGKVRDLPSPKQRRSPWSG